MEASSVSFHDALSALRFHNMDEGLALDHLLRQNSSDWHVVTSAEKTEKVLPFRSKNLRKPDSFSSQTSQISYERFSQCISLDDDSLVNNQSISRNVHKTTSYLAPAREQSNIVSDTLEKQNNPDSICRSRIDSRMLKQRKHSPGLMNLLSGLSKTGSIGNDLNQDSIKKECTVQNQKNQDDLLKSKINYRTPTIENMKTVRNTGKKYSQKGNNDILPKVSNLGKQDNISTTENNINELTKKKKAGDSKTNQYETRNLKNVNLKKNIFSENPTKLGRFPKLKEKEEKNSLAEFPLSHQETLKSENSYCTHSGEIKIGKDNPCQYIHHSSSISLQDEKSNVSFQQGCYTVHPAPAPIMAYWTVPSSFATVFHYGPGNFEIPGPLADTTDIFKS